MEIDPRIARLRAQVDTLERRGFLVSAAPTRLTDPVDRELETLIAPRRWQIGSDDLPTEDIYGAR